MAEMPIDVPKTLKMHFAAGFILAIETAELVLKQPPVPGAIGGAGAFVSAGELCDVLRAAAAEMGLQASYDELQALRAAKVD